MSGVWADLEADATAEQAAEGFMEGVVRVESRSYSARFTMPGRSLHEWAARLACGVVDGKLGRLRWSAGAVAGQG